MGIRLTKVSPMCSVQDLGRQGYLAYGFSPSGALDRRAAALANILVGNDENEALIETTYAGVSGTFTSAGIIALTGADVFPHLNGTPISMYRAVAVQKGDVLECGFMTAGCRAYLAFHSGLYLKKVMGSYATNLKCGIGGYQGRLLKNGDLLFFYTTEPKLANLAERALPNPAEQANSVTVRVILGPQDDYFTDAGVQTFFAGEYTLTKDADRMGLKLDGAAIESKAGVDIVSDGIALGSVQIPASGKPIIMLADRQTTGGYAKIATVITADIPLLAQMRPGETLRFQKVSMEEGHAAYKEARAYLEGVKQKWQK